MAEVFDTAEDVVESFDGTETYDEAELALRDFPSKEVAVTNSMLLAGAGGGGEFALIEALDLDAPAASFDFDDIPQTFAHLKLRAVVRGADDSGGINVLLRCNGEAGTSYDSAFILTDGAAVTTGNEAAGDDLHIASAPDSTYPAGEAAFVEIDLYFYADTSFEKQIRAVGGTHNNVFIGLRQILGVFRDTDPITRVTLTPNTDNWAAGSKATLYGIGVAL